VLLHAQRQAAVRGADADRLGVEFGFDRGIEVFERVRHGRNVSGFANSERWAWQKSIPSRPASPPEACRRVQHRQQPPAQGIVAAKTIASTKIPAPVIVLSIFQVAGLKVTAVSTYRTSTTRNPSFPRGSITFTATRHGFPAGRASGRANGRLTNPLSAANFESPRLLRRLYCLRAWSHEKNIQILTGGP
jgi:hypothetical protein